MSKEHEEVVARLEEIIRQNAEILEHLSHKSKSSPTTGAAAFWSNLFSENGTAIVFFICVVLVLIFVF